MKRKNLKMFENVVEPRKTKWCTFDDEHARIQTGNWIWCRKKMAVTVSISDEENSSDGAGTCVNTITDTKMNRCLPGGGKRECSTAMKGVVVTACEKYFI